MIKLTLIYFILFLQISFLSLAKSNIATISEDILDLSVKPYCEGENVSKNNFFKLNEIEFLDLRFDNSKRFYKGLFKILTSETTYYRDLMYEEKLNMHKAFVDVKFKNNVVCKFRAKVRIHGDGIDHYQFMDGNPTSSMHIELYDDSIDGITKFKLFLPSAESGDNEIFNTLLFREIGIISPRTININVKLHNKIYPYIFQEVLSKEMLEHNFRRDGIIIEKNEDSNGIGLARIDNKSWLKKNLRNKTIGSEVLGDFNVVQIRAINDLLLNNYPTEDFFAHISKIDYEYLAPNKDNLNILSNFEALTIASNSEHTLALNDRRFYYDEVTGYYHPIYYDGESYLFENDKKHNFSLVTKYAKNNANIVRDKIKKIDIKNFLKKLEKANVNINYDEVKLYFDKILKNLDKLEKSKILDISQKSNDLTYLNNFIPKETKLVFGDQILISVCDFNLIYCEEFDNNENFFDSLIKQRFNEKNLLDYDPKMIAYFGNSKLKYYGQEIFKNPLSDIKKVHYGINKWQEIEIEENVILKFKENTIIELDKDNKKLDINFDDINSRALIFGKNSSLDNWKIKLLFNSKYDDNSINLIENTTNLTGCLTLLDIEIVDIEIYSKDSFCEDSVNLIRTNGSIEKLEIENSISDGLDADFSNLKFKYITVSNSSNDCVDLSYGNYILQNVLLTNCTDKALSIGEKSRVNLKNLEILNSFIGVAVKDSSKIKISENRFINNKYCLAAYRKKQEFMAPIIELNKKISCNKNEILVQNGTEIIKNYQ